MTQHTPTLSYSDGSLWGISPLNARVRLADMRKHSPMNGIDQEANAAFIVKACNSHDELVEALQACLQHNINDMLEFCDMSEMEIDGCGHIIQAREALAKAKGE